jgi:hypothetical protein
VAQSESDVLDPRLSTSIEGEAATALDVAGSSTAVYRLYKR